MEPPPGRTSPELMEDLVESILLRVPPDDPRTLLRAALVCKAWCRLISGPGFRRRFYKLHRSPPILGFVFRRGRPEGPGPPNFTPTASFRGLCADVPTDNRWCPVDARHGRILFFHWIPSPAPANYFMAWDPIMGRRRGLPMPPLLHTCVQWNAALLCAAAGCDHLACCPRGPFRVVLVGTRRSYGHTTACVYSSEAGTWSETASVEHPRGFVEGAGRLAAARHGYASRCLVTLSHCTLAANAFYFFIIVAAEEIQYQILEYDVVNQHLSVISSLPSECKRRYSYPAVITLEDGGLGLACVKESKIQMWSKEEAAHGREWMPHRTIELDTLLPFDTLASPKFIAFANGIDMVVAIDHIGVFSIRLKSGHITKIGEIRDKIHNMFPYLSFYTPRIILGEDSIGYEMAGSSQT